MRRLQGTGFPAKDGTVDNTARLANVTITENLEPHGHIY